MAFIVLALAVAILESIVLALVVLAMIESLQQVGYLCGRKQGGEMAGHGDRRGDLGMCPCQNIGRRLPSNRPPTNANQYLHRQIIRRSQLQPSTTTDDGGLY